MGQTQMRERMGLEEEIGLLADLPRSELVARWTKLYRSPPPKGIKRGLLERAVAWHLQAKHHGGLSPNLRKQLENLATSAFGDVGNTVDRTQSLGKNHSPSLRSVRLEVGTRLLREWHGKSYVVDVIDDGFLYDGRQFASLSAIAREITGTRWSGPRFFGS